LVVSPITNAGGAVTVATTVSRGDEEQSTILPLTINCGLIEYVVRFEVISPHIVAPEVPGAVVICVCIVDTYDVLSTLQVLDIVAVEAGLP
jgi:hypothetical protein